MGRLIDVTKVRPGERIASVEFLNETNCAAQTDYSVSNFMNYLNIMYMNQWELFQIQNIIFENLEKYGKPNYRIAAVSTLYIMSCPEKGMG